MRINRASSGCVLVYVCAVAASACRVAVVGGGVGGAFSAAFLHELLGASTAVDVYAVCCDLFPSRDIKVHWHYNFNALQV